MVDTNGKQDNPRNIRVQSWIIGYLDQILKNTTPATVLYEIKSGIVILIIHAYEMKGGNLVVANVNDSKRTLATDYHFFRAKRQDDSGHPVFGLDEFSLIKWGLDKSTQRTIPYPLLQLAMENVSWQERLIALCAKSGRIP